MSAAATSGGGRPAAYKTADGKRVPGVTTILSRFKESGGLIHWAWNLGTQGIDYRAARDAAGDVGHLAHQWIDDHLHGRDLAPSPDGTSPDTRDKAGAALQAFRDWTRQVRLEVLDTERPLISEQHRFGGTYDAIAVCDGTLMLLDWKSSNRIYPEYVCQIAAYRALIHENAKGAAVPEAACLLRVGKEMGDFHYHSFPPAVLDVGWAAFLHMRALYDIDATLKKVVG